MLQDMIDWLFLFDSTKHLNVDIHIPILCKHLSYDMQISVHFHQMTTRSLCRDLKKRLKILKGIPRSCKSKDRQHNGKKQIYKRTNNDLQNTSGKLKTDNTNPFTNPGMCACVLQKGKQSLHHYWHPSCY
jgi:hypothetical protein